MPLRLRDARALFDGQFDPARAGHPHFWDRALSRRRFLGTAALASGAAAATTLSLPSIAAAAPPGPGTPRPISGTLDGSPFHIQLPGLESEPSVITDFSGMVAIADIVGTAVGTHDPSGLIFDADVRFMDGHFVGTDGRVHQRALGFVWIDVFVGVPDDNTFSNQIHDFNPGINPFPDGLFWLLSSDQPISTAANLGQGTASYKATNVALGDYTSIPNSLNNGPFVPARATFDVEWSGIIKRSTFRSAAQRFALEFVQTGATITWSASTSATSLHSTGVTGVNFAEVAHEVNGVFF